MFDLSIAEQTKKAGNKLPNIRGFWVLGRSQLLLNWHEKNNYQKLFCMLLKQPCDWWCNQIMIERTSFFSNMNFCPYCIVIIITTCFMVVILMSNFQLLRHWKETSDFKMLIFQFSKQLSWGKHLNAKWLFLRSPSRLKLFLSAARQEVRLYLLKLKTPPAWYLLQTSSESEPSHLLLAE